MQQLRSSKLVLQILDVRSTAACCNNIQHHKSSVVANSSDHSVLFSRGRAHRAEGDPSCSSPSPSWPGTPACPPQTQTPCRCRTRHGPSSQHAAHTRLDHGGSRRARRGSRLQSRCLATPCETSIHRSVLKQHSILEAGQSDPNLSVHTRNIESAVCLFRNSLMFVMRWAWSNAAWKGRTLICEAFLSNRLNTFSTFLQVSI
jgi:hypothetical protein